MGVNFTRWPSRSLENRGSTQLQLQAEKAKSWEVIAVRSNAEPKEQSAGYVPWTCRQLTLVRYGGGAKQPDAVAKQARTVAVLSSGTSFITSPTPRSRHRRGCPRGPPNPFLCRRSGVGGVPAVPHHLHPWSWHLQQWISCDFLDRRTKTDQVRTEKITKESKLVGARRQTQEIPQKLLLE